MSTARSGHLAVGVEEHRRELFVAFSLESHRPLTLW